MQFTRLEIPEVVRIDQEQIADSRGFFARLLCREELHAHGIAPDVVQCNNSVTIVKGSIRGFHFQYPPKSESKIVRCIRGSIFDVAIDLREGSKTFGRYCSCELTDTNRSMLAVPSGFAHGFQTLTDDAELIYFCSAPYSPELERGVHPLDPDVEVDWPLPVAEMSDRDRSLPRLCEIKPIKL